MAGTKGKSKRSKMRKHIPKNHTADKRWGRILLPACGALLLIAAIAVGALAAGDRFRLSINGLAVTEAEYERMLNSQIYPVSQSISAEYGLQTGVDFWTRDAGGVPAYRILADRTVDALKRYRALYEIAQEQGYVADISYDALLSRVEEENRSRAEKIANGEAVYGLSSFTADLFLEYEADAIRTRYCDDPDSPGMDIPEDEIRDGYEARKETDFLRDDDLSITYVKIRYEQLGMSQTDAARLKERLEALAGQTGPLYDLAAADSELSPYLERRELGAVDYRAASREIPDILALADGLEAGARSAVTDESGALCLVECTARRQGGYTPYEEARDYVLKDLREEAFDQLLTQRAAGAAVTGDMESVYRSTEKAVS